MSEIRWTNTAREEYALLLKNIYETSMDAAVRLDEEVEALQDRLSLFKSLCPPHAKIPTMRRCVVSRFVSLVYDVLGEDIIVISIFDSRSEHPFN
jgi:plasmid stabilization system protein ParE